MERGDLARLLGTFAAGREPGAKPALVADRDPARFMSGFAAAVGGGGAVFLADPSWGASERLQLSEAMARGSARSGTARGWLCIPTGGTGGGLKWARHDGLSVAAAVAGFSAHFQVSRVNAIGVLPLHHVSGLMAWMRCALTGGDYRPWDWNDLAVGRYPVLPDGAWFLSLVPTQLQRLLELPGGPEWMRGFRTIFIGGGPVWTELADRATSAELPLSLSYGMTETAAMVAAQLPGEFRAGGRDCGAPLPHAAITCDSDGVIAVEGGSVFCGYWPEFDDARRFATSDLGTLDGHGHLRVMGRRDAVIISGGEKVNTDDVEAALRATGEFSDVAVFGIPDATWGEAVVACFPSADRSPDLARVAALLESLAPYKRPKRYVPVRDWPRNAQGKLNRAALAAGVPP